MGRYDWDSNERARFRQRKRGRQNGPKVSSRGTIILLVSSLALIGTFGLVFSQNSFDQSDGLLAQGGNAVVSMSVEPVSVSADSTSISRVSVDNQLTQHVTQQVRFVLCAKVRVNCVVDGDTLWINGVKIRVADIDTPEVSTPRCPYEKALGEQATYRLLDLVNAGPFELKKAGERDEDPFGRKLRVLMRDGESLGDILVSEGLARVWTGKQEPWC